MKLNHNYPTNTPYQPFKQHVKPPTSPKQWYSEQDLLRASKLLDTLSLQDKIGQLHQVNGDEGQVSDELAELIRSGRLGSVINEVHLATIQELQRIAIEESPHGIPLLIGRDVIHGFKTIFPLPIGLAATWDTQLVEKTARYAAIEASREGINWTFSPMIDVSRDARWGRIAESAGEDPLLNSVMAQAMVRGYQGDDLSDPTAIAACAKHFVGYGASEAGRDYNTTNLSNHDFYNVYLSPFKSAINAGSATVMTSFSDVNGVPVSGNRWLLTEVLREQCHFSGMVVSDWGSVEQLITHGIAADRKHAAFLGLQAGVDMEMVSGTFHDHAEELIEQQHILEAQINLATLRILTLKFALGLFDCKQQLVSAQPEIDQQTQLAITSTAKQAAIQSCVLLKNEKNCLPLNLAQPSKIALIGFLAEDPYEMLGTWIFDGDITRSITLKQALESQCADSKIQLEYAPAFVNSRSEDDGLHQAALECCDDADSVILCLGEESILSGEAHCKTDTGLSQSQLRFAEKLASLNKKVICVIMSGRPLLLSAILPHLDALLYAWHPGTMGGSAIAELLFGKASPSGRLPASLLRAQGQVPYYYSHKMTGRPVTEKSFSPMQDFPQRAPQTSLGMASFHMDCHFTPLFPFGYGLTYADLEYANLALSSEIMGLDDKLVASIEVINHSDCDALETVQLYIRDFTASQTRPVKELKQFKQLTIEAQTKKTVSFELSSNDLGFYTDQGDYLIEEGEFMIWIGPHAQSNEYKHFSLAL